jgi:tRNA (guanine-N7-)-methyltransferase
VTETPIRYQDMAPRLPEGAIDLGALVPGGGELELDVGFGRGASIFERAAAAPGARILGIELKAKWVYKVDERRKRLALDRVRVFAADAREALARSGPDGCLARVFVHFPDPWWKKRHAKRRVLGDAFLDDLARLIAPHGELFVQTDVKDRAERYRDAIRAHAAFELAGEDGYVSASPFGARSNREIRAARDGLPVWRVLARRR